MAPGQIKTAPGKPPVSGTRLPADNISNLKAQVASNRKGIELVLQMVDHYGRDVAQVHMGHAQDAAEGAVRSRLKELSKSKGVQEVDTVRAIDYLDDGSPIALSPTIDRRDGSASLDFEGTGHQIRGNCIAPITVTTSAILCCLRCLFEKDLPLDYGCLIPVNIKIPEGSLLDPLPEAPAISDTLKNYEIAADRIQFPVFLSNHAFRCGICSLTPNMHVFIQFSFSTPFPGWRSRGPAPPAW